MAAYPEISSSTYIEVEGIRYIVRKFGLNGHVFEEERTPFPTQKIIRTMNPDGSEDIPKQIIEDL